jgi:hypothetical protein
MMVQTAALVVARVVIYQYLGMAAQEIPRLPTHLKEMTEVIPKIQAIIPQVAAAAQEQQGQMGLLQVMVLVATDRPQAFQAHL